MREMFINELVASMADRFSTDDLQYIRNKLTLKLANYDLQEMCTDVVVYEEIPEAVKVYLVTLKIQGLSEGSLKQYGIRLREFFQYVRKPLKEIGATDVKVFLYSIQNDRGISNRTLDGIRGIVSTFLKWCAAEGYIDKDPTLTIRSIKYEVKERGFLSEEEVELLRGSCENERDAAMIEVFYSTGCRVSEVVEMNVNDVNLNTMEMVVTGKGNKQRKVYINARCKVAIQRYLMTRQDNNPALFVSERKPYNRFAKSGFEKRIGQLGEIAGIQRKVFPHLIRHTTASHAIQRGMPVENVRQILGHSSLDTTMIYADIADRQVKESHRKCIV